MVVILENPITEREGQLVPVAVDGVFCGVEPVFPALRIYGFPVFHSRVHCGDLCRPVAKRIVLSWIGGMASGQMMPRQLFDFTIIFEGNGGGDGTGIQRSLVSLPHHSTFSRQR